MTAEAIGFAEEALFEPEPWRSIRSCGDEKEPSRYPSDLYVQTGGRRKRWWSCCSGTPDARESGDISRRFTLKRREETVETAYGPVRKKDLPRAMALPEPSWNMKI